MTDWNAIWDEVEDEQQRRLRATMLTTGGLTPERAARATQAMFGMRKLDIEQIRAAADAG